MKTSEQKAVEEKVAEIKGDQKKANQDMRTKALDHGQSFASPSSREI